MTIPWRTPTKATPSPQATASANSVLRTSYSRRSSATSNRLIDAAMMTAARTGCGIAWTRPGTTTSISQHESRGDETGQLRLRPGLEGDRRPRAAGAHREAREEAGGQVGGADAGELLVAVDLVAAARGEAARGRDRVADGDERDPDRGREQQRDVRQLGPRQGRKREALRQHADHRDTTRRRGRARSRARSRRRRR